MNVTTDEPVESIEHGQDEGQDWERERDDEQEPHATEHVDSDRDEFFDEEGRPYEEEDEGEGDESRTLNDNDQKPTGASVHTPTHPSRSIHDRTDKNENVGHMIPSRPPVNRANDLARGTHRPVLPTIPSQSTVLTNGDSSTAKVTRRSTGKTGVDALPTQASHPSEDITDAQSSSSSTSSTTQLPHADPLIRVEINEKQKPGQKPTRPIVKSRTEPSEAVSSQKNPSRPRQPTRGDELPNQTSIEITVSDPASGKRFSRLSLGLHFALTLPFQDPPAPEQHERVGQLCEARW